MDHALRESVAIKADIAEVKSDVESVKREFEATERRLEAKIETTAANLEVDVLRWLVLTQVALGGFLFATIKFLK